MRWLALALALIAPAAWAQHPIEIPREEAPRERMEAPIIPNGHLTGRVGRLAIPGLERQIVWKKTADGSYEAFDEKSNSSTPLDAAALKALYASGAPVVHLGDVPPASQLREITGGESDQTVIRKKSSVNQDAKSIARATMLASRPLSPENTVIFNALPQERDAAASKQERSRMQIVGTGEAWGSLNDGIERASEGFKSQTASKAALLEEFRTGTSNVVVIYAHFDGTRLHLPGKEGSLGDNSISLEELSQIDRSGQPANRLVILVACNTAAPSANKGPSLVNVMLEKGIARSVMATDRPYDARDIPALMERFRQGTPVREAGGQLRQYVELAHANV